MDKLAYDLVGKTGKVRWILERITENFLNKFTINIVKTLKL